MSMIQSDLLLGQEGSAGYVVERSLRFSSIDSAYCSRVPSTAGNRKTWTWSGWVKKVKNESILPLINARQSSSDFLNIWFDSGDGLFIRSRVGGSDSFYAYTAAVFRDPSAWYHVLIAVDTTQASSSNGVKVYVNGTQQTLTIPTYNQNADTYVNSTFEHRIGYLINQNSSTYYLDSYLADLHLIDGQQLDPSAFVAVSATTGQLIPKAYTGTFTGNSFWLKFADNSAATATTLGKDSSGLGNNWAPNNFSIGGITYSSATNGNTPVYDIQIGPTNDLSGTYVWSNAFDANGSTIGLIGPITFINTKPTWSTSAGVEVMAAGNGITATVNGGTQVACTNGGWTTISTGSSGTLNSIWVYSSTGASYFYGVRVDGVEIAVRRQIDDNKNNDCLVDTPTSGSQVDTGLGGQVTGNYCTLNALSSALTLSNGNLDFSKGSAADWKVAKSTFFVSTGKWYWEVTVAAYSSGTQPIIFGIANSSSPLSGTDTDITSGLNGYFKDGQKRVNSSTSSYGASYTNGDVIGFALDLDAGTLTAYKNGSSQGTLMSGITGSWTPAVGLYTGGTQLSSDSLSINFGQRSWAYAAPSNHRPLVDTLLPSPVVAKSSDYFQTVLYTGNGSTQTISGLGFSPDLVWIKERSGTQAGDAWHALFDSVRGNTKALYSNDTNAETTGTAFTSFDSLGFTVGLDTSQARTNDNNDAYVAWTWDAGTTTSSNGSGSITSQVRANASAGFSIVTYTGNGSSAQTVGHGLGIAPSLVVVKKRSATDGWLTYFTGFNSNEYLYLNSTAAKASYSGTWGSTPTSTVFGVGDAVVNANGATFVAYCWAPVAGYSTALSWTGNGSSDGVFLWCGFRPRLVLIKATNSSTDPWVLLDTARNPYNVTTNYLLANSSGAEGSTTLYDLLSNGIKFRSTAQNDSGVQYVAFAWAESPFQYARAR